jgi:hypothetical protein
MSASEQAPASTRLDTAVVTKLSSRSVADTVARRSAVVAE